MTFLERNIVWANSAVADYAAQIEYLSLEVNLEAAKIVKERLINAANSLKFLPTGRIGRVEGTFEKIVAKTSLILVYKIIDDKTISIVHVIHTARDWQGNSFPS